MSVTVLDGATQVRAASITNAEIAAAAALAYSKLALTGSIVNADVAAGAAIASSKLANWGADRNAGGFKLTNLTSPSVSGDAATKGYVDSNLQGLRLKDTVELATNAALTAYTVSGNILTASANGALTVDGAAANNGDRVLAKNESGANEKYNGWYDVTDKGSGTTPWILTRSSDADVASELKEGSFSWVRNGTANGNTRWAVVTEPTTLNTDPIAFTQISGAAELTAGNALTKTGNTLDVVAAANGGIQIVSDALEIKLDGATLALSVSGVKVADNGITGTQLATSVAGAGIAGGGGSALSLDLSKQSFVGDGSTTAFALSNTPMTDGEMIFKGGFYQKKGSGNDYTISGATITFATAPVNGANIEAQYWKA